MNNMLRKSLSKNVKSNLMFFLLKNKKNKLKRPNNKNKKKLEDYSKKPKSLHRIHQPPLQPLFQRLNKNNQL